MNMNNENYCFARKKFVWNERTNNKLQLITIEHFKMSIQMSFNIIIITQGEALKIVHLLMVTVSQKKHTWVITHFW